MDFFKKALPLLLISTALVVVVLSGSDDGVVVDDSAVNSEPPSTNSMAADAVSVGGRSNVDIGQATDKSAIWGVVATANGQALSGAMVALVPTQAFDLIGLPQKELARIALTGIQCSNGGAFRLPVYDAGAEYRVVAFAEGYAGFRTSEISPGQRVDINLEPLVLLTGQLTYESGVPVAGAQLQLQSLKASTDGLPALVSSDLHGNFKLRAPKSGNYKLVVRSALASDETFTPVKITAPHTQLNFQLKSQPSLSLRLTNSNNEVLPKVVVKAKPAARQSGQMGFKSASSDAKGICKFGGMTPGYWFFQISAPGYAQVEQRLKIIEGSQEKTVILTKSSSLTVNTLGLNGEVVGEVPVRLLPLTRKSILNQAPSAQISNEDGQAVWEGILPGNYAVLAVGIAGGRAEEDVRGGGPGTQPSSTKLELAAGQSLEVDLHLDGHGFLDLVVKRGSMPEQGAEVSLAPQIDRAGASSPTISDEFGALRLTPVRPGKYQYFVKTQAGEEWLGGNVDIVAGLQEAELSLPSGSINLTVNNQGEPLFDARAVLLKMPAGTAHSTATADAEGTIGFELIGKGEWKLEVRSPGLLPWVSSKFSTNGIEPFSFGEITLSAAASLLGKIHGLPKLKKGGFNVRYIEIKTESGQLLNSYALRADNKFQFEGLAPMGYLLNVILGTKVLASQRVQLEAGSQEIEINLQ